MTHYPSPPGGKTVFLKVISEIKYGVYMHKQTFTRILVSMELQSLRV